MHCRDNLHLSQTEKHEQFMAALRSLTNGWGLVTPDTPQIKIPKNFSYFVDVSLTRYMGKGITAGVSYENRALKDPAPDNFELLFTPARVDYAALLDTVEFYIESFRAHSLSIFMMDLLSFASELRPLVTGRDFTAQIHPIHYLDDRLCLNSFSLSARQVFKGLSDSNEFERVQMVGDGVLFMYSTRILTLDEQRAVDPLFRKVLGLPDPRQQATPQ